MADIVDTIGIDIDELKNILDNNLQKLEQLSKEDFNYIYLCTTNIKCIKKIYESYLNNISEKFRPKSIIITFYLIYLSNLIIQKCLWKNKDIFSGNGAKSIARKLYDITSINLFSTNCSFIDNFKGEKDLDLMIFFLKILFTSIKMYPFAYDKNHISKLFRIPTGCDENTKSECLKRKKYCTEFCDKIKKIYETCHN